MPPSNCQTMGHEHPADMSEVMWPSAPQQEASPETAWESPTPPVCPPLRPFGQRRKFVSRVLARPIWASPASPVEVRKCGCSPASGQGVDQLTGRPPEVLLTAACTRRSRSDHCAAPCAAVTVDFCSYTSRHPLQPSSDALLPPAALCAAPIRLLLRCLLQQACCWHRSNLALRPYSTPPHAATLKQPR